ncbi:DUF1801 domain-containing protein [Phenylobacterium sp.]|uniref:DUF1801 domain-containing protein n=1 Tax=Phenylobacterium sp. TaxID=1871053 RepID=UPI0025E79181|nr:DUF1801 domain-containing protein [Phenylobacterium sp.]
MAAPDSKVGAVFDAVAPAQRAALLALRDLILQSAADAGVDVVETLKWGEPAYLPLKPRVGTTVRINAVKGSATGYAMYVNCKTTLLESYRHLYGDALRFEGQRAVVFSTERPLPEAALKHCIALALTYHLSK